jgi:hypothetical protein
MKQNGRIRKILAASVLLMIAVAALAGPEPFPPRKPNPMPEFTIPAVGNSLDEEWVFVDTLFDAGRSNPELFGAYPVGLKFSKSGRGLLATLHTIFRTSDAGESWSNLDVTPPPQHNNTWESVRPPAYISDINFRPTETQEASGDSLFVAVVNSGGENGFMRLLRNVGGSMVLWQIPFFTTNNWITHVAAPEHETALCFAGLDGKIFRYDSIWTTFIVDTLVFRDSIDVDSTLLLDSIFAPRWDTLDYNFFGTWVDDVEVIGKRVIAAGSHHLTSEDLGRTWLPQEPADPDGVRDLDFADDFLSGLACGANSELSGGWVRHSSDGGLTWSDRTLETIAPMKAVHMVTGEIGFAVGGDINQASGRVYRTDDGGQTWALELLTNAEMRVVNSARVSNAYVNVIAAGVFPDFSCGVWKSRLFLPISEGPVLRAEPDRLDFGDVAPGLTDTLLFTIRNLGDDTATITGIAVDSEQFISLWTETVELLPDSSVETPVVFAPDTTGYFSATATIQNVANDNVWVELRGSSGITAVDPPAELLPRSTALRVWPNPGNAEFRIGYEIDHAQDITLAVYDLTGRLVTMLEQGPQTSGVNIARWDGTAHASGLYFVRLTTSSGKAITKKLMFLK